MRLQSLPENFIMHENEKVALKQLGNSVNVDVVHSVLTAMGIYNETTIGV